MPLYTTSPSLWGFGKLRQQLVSGVGRCLQCRASYSQGSCRKAHRPAFPLDIQMPELKLGLEFSKMVDFNTRIVFTTAFVLICIDGYKVNALDYLLKPIYIDFLQAANKAVQWFEMPQQPNK